MSGTALTEYNNARITRNLQSIGKACFVTYFSMFDNYKLSTKDIIEQMKKDGKTLRINLIGVGYVRRAVSSRRENLGML